MATTANTILTVEPSRVHTLTSLTFLVSTQAKAYLLTNPYALPSQPWLTTHLSRLVPSSTPPSSPICRKPQLLKDGTPTDRAPRLFGKVVMNEDVLLLLSSVFVYRISLCKQATSYKNVIFPAYMDCAKCDVEAEVEAYLAFEPSPPSQMQGSSSLREASAEKKEKKEVQRKEAARRQGRCVDLQNVIELVEKAELFAKPPGKYAAAHKEAKGAVYLALVVLGNGGKVEEQIARLGSVKREVCRGNVYQPKFMVGYGGPGPQGVMK